MTLFRRTLLNCAGAGAALSVCIGLTACGTLYRTPTPEQPPLPSRFPHATQVTDPAPLDGWWHAFNDPELDALVDAVLQRNDTLAAAALHLKAAQLQVHLAVTNPTVSASVDYANSKPLSGHTPSIQSDALAASVSYDLDLWGTLAATRDAATWEAHAAAQDRDSVGIILVANTVDDYFQIASLNQLLTLSDQDVAAAEQQLALTQVLKGAGGATALDVATAQQNLDAQVANHASLVEQRVEARHALSVLLDDEDWPAARERAAIPQGPLPAVDAGIPASVLGHRPDLRAAELRLRESLATVEATRRSFYPDLSLTGSVGTNSVSLGNLLANPLGTLGATLTFPFLQVDHAIFATQVARVNYDAAAATFRQTLRQALTDVDNALSARAQYQIQIDALDHSLQEAITVEHLTEVLYHAGSVPLQTWLTDQATRRAAAEALVNTRLLAIQNYATLCLALGGGPRRTG